MIFGFFKKKEEVQEEEPDLEPVRFLGALNGKDANLAANARLADAGLVPAKDLITDAMARRADTLRIEPKGPQAVVTILIDGIAYPSGKLAKAEALAVTQMLKLLAGLDTKQRKVAQSGGIKAEFDSKPYQLMVVVTPLPEAERLTVRIVDLSIKLENPSDLGMSEDLRKKLREITSLKGLLLAVGPPGSGTTTTLYAVLRGTDAYLSSIFTIGDTGGRNLFNITPFETNPGDSLSTTLDRVVRVEANVILIDPIKDAETAKVAISKHEDVMILSEFPAKDAAAGLVQLIEWTGDPKTVAAAFKGIISQKLLRLLCADCKQAYRPNKEFLKKAGLPAEATTLYRKPQATQDPNYEPCRTCGDVGYLGRVAMFELLEPSEEMQQLILKKPDAAAIRAQMKKEKMLTLLQDGLRLVAEGKTALEELQRVFKAPEK